MKIRKDLFAIMVITMMAFTALGHADSPYPQQEAGFSIILEVTEYGQRSVGVIIDAGRQVAGDGLETDTFRVWQHMAQWPGTSQEQTVGHDCYRKVTAAYVSNEPSINGSAFAVELGRYIVLELEHGYFLGIEGNTYDPASTRFTLDYKLTQTKPFGDVNIGDISFIQTGVIDPIADGFEASTFFSPSVKGYFRGYRMDQLDYALYSPANENASVKYPLVVVFHGGYEAKEFLKGMTSEDKPQMMAYQSAVAFAAPAFQKEHGGAYVLAPWFNVMPPDWYYSDEGATVVMELMNNLIQTNPDIDTDRIYLVGLSTGGGMVWSMLIHQDAKTFAGAIAIASVRLPTREEVQKTVEANVPIWLVHGTADKVIDVKNSRIPAAYFADMDYQNYRYTELTDIISSKTGIEYSAGSQQGRMKTVLSHLSWIPVFNNQIMDEKTALPILDWLFEQKR